MFEKKILQVFWFSMNFFQKLKLSFDDDKYRCLKIRSEGLGVHLTGLKTCLKVKGCKIKIQRSTQKYFTTEILLFKFKKSL